MFTHTGEVFYVVWYRLLFVSLVLRAFVLLYNFNLSMKTLLQLLCDQVIVCVRRGGVSPPGCAVSVAFSGVYVIHPSSSIPHVVSDSHSPSAGGLSFKSTCRSSCAYVFL